MGRRVGIDFPVAVMAFLIALLLWFHVITEKEYIQEVEIPLRIENEPKELVLITTPPRAVGLRIGGTGKEILKYNLRHEPSFCRLDVSKARRGEMLYTLGDQSFELPYGLELVDISDKQFQLRFDRRVKRSIKVKANIIGSPEEGYTVVKEIVEPEEVFLFGSEILLRNIDAVESEPINIDGESKPFQITAELVPPKGRGWELAPDSVFIELLIEKILAVAYDSIPVKLRNRPRRRRVSVSPEFIKFTLSGAESTMRELDITQIVVEIDVEALPKGEYSLPARIKLPEGVNLISASPKRFNVIIE